MNKTRIVCAMHRLAQRWAGDNGFAPDSFISVTHHKALRGIPANTAIIVVDTPYKFEDSRALYAALEQFTNVQHTQLAIG